MFLKSAVLGDYRSELKYRGSHLKKSSIMSYLLHEPPCILSLYAKKCAIKNYYTRVRGFFRNIFRFLDNEFVPSFMYTLYKRPIVEIICKLKDTAT